jgi:hypothetical protein
VDDVMAVTPAPRPRAPRTVSHKTIRTRIRLQRAVVPLVMYSGATVRDGTVVARSSGAVARKLLGQ